ncbi:MAG: insulinase family protein [Alphaproteobacteria bacterium]|nr:insulinase family protein [Alphaproteobacteria bacterium]
MKRLFVLLLLIGLAFTGQARAGVYNPRLFTLDNGMRVVVLPNHRAPVILHMVWYKVGAADEPDGVSGVAHVLEHLMFKGTPKHPDGAFSRILAQNGGQENAFTGYDYTGYYQIVASDRLGLVMELEADRMTNLVLSEQDFQTERAVVIEERNQRTENSPAARLSEQATRNLYPDGHPYGRPIIGWRGELENLTRDDVMAFYRAHYAPANAVLVVAGDVDADEVRRLAEIHYGPIVARAVPARRDLVDASPVAGGETVLRDARVTQPTWSEAALRPSFANGAPRETAALEVLAEVLGGGSTSRLYRALVIDRPLAVSAGAGYDGDARGEGKFTLYAAPRPGQTLDTVAEAVRAELARLKTDGLADGELDRVKKRMLADAVFARDAMKAGAWALGGILAAGHEVADIEDWPARIEAVTAADVLAALEGVLAEERRIITKLLPEGDGA